MPQWSTRARIDRGAVGEREAELMNRAQRKDDRRLDPKPAEADVQKSDRHTQCDAVAVELAQDLDSRGAPSMLERWDAESSWFIVVPVCESI